MQISRKLFLSFMGLTLIILLATLSMARWSFSQGFLNYFDAIELRRLEYIGQDMIEQYHQAGDNWANLPSQAFFDVMMEYSSVDEFSILTRPSGGPPGNRGALPNRSNRGPGSNTPGATDSSSSSGPNNSGPASSGPASSSPNNSGPGSIPGDTNSRPSIGGPGMPPPMMDIPPDYPPTMLVDRMGNFVSGVEFNSDSADVLDVPLLIDGKLIGWVKSVAPDRLDFDLAQEFAQQQLWTSILIGLFCLALSVTLALSLSSFLLNPMWRVIRAVSRMSDGDYSVRLNEDRHDELGKMMRNIDHLGKTLEQNQSSKNRWLADISHELRTPLTILNGELEMLQEGLKPFDQTQLESLQQEVDRMSHLVNDLYQLSLSEIGGLRYNFDQVDIETCIMSAASACQTKLQDKGLTLTVKCENHYLIRADDKRLEQLFLNLLINSAAYTDSSGQICVELHDEGGYVIVNIDDTKPSVSQQECDLLLEPLYRTDMSRTRRGEGAGLGLTICKNIIEAHGGGIELTPSKLGGLNVQIKFKLEDKKL